MAVARALVAIAALVLLHAAFSAYEHLSTLKALGRPATVPASIALEALGALALFLPSVALAAQPLRDVTFRGELAKRSPDDTDVRMGFMRLSSRGRALFGDTPVPAPSS